MVVGSDTININDIYFGKGVTNESPQSFTINATGGNGTDISGASAIIAGGKATGIGNGGDVKIRTSVPGSSGSTLQLLGDRLNIKGKYINLINSTPTTISTVNIPEGTVAGGSVNYTIEATDATDFQALTGSVIWSAVNKAGALTIAFDDDQQTSPAVTIGTLSSIATVVDGGGGNLEIKLTVISSLTGATIRVSFLHWKNFGTGDIV
ncbi:MAG: hypothetical protein KatS3mg002_1379 [Candidatus Woesearchaeota archaeon]|nr:MAG: hypothetical protein KatS3mg002_1379 [Candidatus Woesearchaeota archaeon]